MTASARRTAVLDVVPGLLVDCAFYLDVFALQFLVRSLGGSSLGVALVFGIYTVVYAVLAPLLGRASDRGDRRRVLRTSALLFAAIPAALAAVLVVRPGAAPDTVVVTARLAPGPFGPTAWVYLASASFALSNGLFWPALQARIGDRETDPVARGRAIRRFNVGWTIGKALGFLVGGVVFQRAPGACLPLGAVLAAAVFLLLLLDRPAVAGGAPAPAPDAPPPSEPAGPPRPSGLPGPPQAVKRAYLLAALAANFAVWSALSTLQSLAPTLARSLGINPQEAGLLVFLALGAQGAVFFSLGGSGAWAYRPLTLLVSTPVAALGLGLVLLAEGLPLAATGALLAGAAQAVTYAASVFYSLDSDHQRGLRTGVHEANLALAGAVPMLGGWVADQAGALRAPLVVALVPCLIAAAVVALLLPRARTEPAT